MAPSQIYRYLSGESTPSLETLEAIAEALGVSAADLLHDDAPPTDQQVVRGLVSNWLELKTRAAGDEDEELFRIVDGLFRYYLEKRKRR